MEFLLFLRVFGFVESIQTAASLWDEDQVVDLFSYSEDDIFGLIECTVKVGKYIHRESLRGLVLTRKVLEEEHQESTLLDQTYVHQFAL